MKNPLSPSRCAPAPRRTWGLAVSVLCLLATALPSVSAQEIRTFPETVDLARCKELALTHNPTIRRARERIRQQQGVIVETNARRIPQAAVNAGYTSTDDGRTEDFGGGGSFNPQNWQADIEVTYSLYGGGRLRLASRAAEAEERAIRADIETTVNDLLLEVDRSYYGALLARRQIEVQEEAISLFERQLELAQNRFKAGSRPRFDVLQAEVALQNARPPLIRARNAYRIGIDDLRRLVGLPFQPGLEPEAITLASDWPFPEIEQDLDTILADALQRRPELDSLKETQTALSERNKIVERSQRPTLDLFANYGAQSLAFEDDLDDYLYGWMVGLQARWAFFDGGSRRGKTQQTTSLLQQTRIAFDEQRLRIEGEVRRAYFDYEVAGDILESALGTIRQSEEALRMANNRYEAGGATQLDVLQAQLETTRARLSKVQADYDYHLAVSRLRRATGLTP